MNDSLTTETIKTENVKTAARTLDLFEAFAEAKAPLSLTELARRINAPVSSCHGLVRTLQARGYVYVLEERKRVYPTKRLLRLAETVAAHDPLLETLRPILTALRDVVGETVILGKQQGQGVIYLDVVEGTRTVRYAALPGDTKPLHSSALGKAMLGRMRGAELQNTVHNLPLPRVTENTIVDAEALIQQIEETQRSGFFITDGENVDDVMAIAIVRTVNQEDIGIALAGPTERMTRNFDHYCRELATHGDRLIQPATF